MSGNQILPSVCGSHGNQGYFWQFWEGAIGPFRLGKLAWLTPKLGNFLNGIFGQFTNKLAITHTITIKLKEK